MKLFRCLLFALAFTAALGSVRGQGTAPWPPSTAAADTINMRMTVIRGLPDSVAVRNPGIFVNKADDDEYDVYVLNKYMHHIFVRATILSPDPDIRGRAKAYAKVMLVNMAGEVVKTVTTSQSGTALIDVENMSIPDGVYRVRVDYGGKHTKDGTKPKSRLELFVSARVSLDKAAARANGDHLRINVPRRR